MCGEFKVDLSGLNKEERNSIETIVAGLLTKRMLKRMLIDQRDAACRAERPKEEIEFVIEMRFEIREDAQRLADALNFLAGKTKVTIAERRCG